MDSLINLSKKLKLEDIFLVILAIVSITLFAYAIYEIINGIIYFFNNYNIDAEFEKFIQ
jgi:hypothetical protein